jgi:hypothetical protein
LRWGEETGLPIAGEERSIKGAWWMGGEVGWG